MRKVNVLNWSQSFPFSKSFIHFALIPSGLIPRSLLRTE